MWGNWSNWMARTMTGWRAAGPRCVLMAYIDDATSRVFARFYEYEGTIPAMDSFQRYVTRYGIPLAVYADKHTTYQSPAPPTVEEQLAGVEPTSQFGRALGELGVELIAAHSPQAKGRVERLFQTFQDRVIKEMRLAGIAHAGGRESGSWRAICRSTIGASRSSRPRPPICIGRGRRARELDRILCIKTTRCLRKDCTIAHHGGLYQVQTTVRATHVLVEEHGGWDDADHAPGPAARLSRHHVSAVRRRRRKTGPPPRRPVTPRPDHPWRTRRLPKHEHPRRPKPKTGHFYFGRKRTFLNWVDSPVQSP